MNAATSTSHHATTARGPVETRGIILVEAVVALVVLLVAMATLAQLLSQAAQQRRLSEQRRLALEEVANQAERLALIAWEDATPENLTTWQPSDALLTVIPRPTCRMNVGDEPGELAARRIRLSVTWNDAAGQAGAPVELTIWKFASTTRRGEEARP